jgi:glycine/D-amino acid oxidase-like deaminating enzyme
MNTLPVRDSLSGAAPLRTCNTTPDVIVVGAGIVGAACAAELALRGMRVEVIDGLAIGGGATAAGMGHIVAMNDSPAELALSRYSRDLWHALAPELGASEGFVRCGTLWVASDEEEWQAARAMAAGLAAQGVDSALLDATALRACEPALAHAMTGGLQVAHDSIVYAPNAARWLLTRSPGAARIRVRLGQDVVAAGPGEVQLADGQRRQAAKVVVANGLGARGLFASMPLVPKKGHLLITDRYPGVISHQILELGYIKSAHQRSGTSVAFNAQCRPTGQILLGSSRQFETTDPSVEIPVLTQMLQRAMRYLPGLRNLNALRSWVGFRAATPDGLPLIGALPKRDDAFADPMDPAAALWVATGHEGLGVTTSLATAKLLCAQMLGEAAPIDARPYLPSRFDMRG